MKKFFIYKNLKRKEIRNINVDKSGSVLMTNKVNSIFQNTQNN